MQVSTAEAQRRGLPAESLLEPCTNLRVGWEILEEDYRVEMKTYGPGQDALRHAISRYNTGDSNSGHRQRLSGPSSRGAPRLGFNYREYRQMTISDTERALRQRAAQSAVASVKMAGLQPSQFLESLLSRWVEGNASLDEVQSALAAEVAQSND